VGEGEQAHLLSVFGGDADGGQVLGGGNPFAGERRRPDEPGHKSAAGSSTLPITELIQECPFQATGMTLFAGPGAPVQFTARRRDVYMVDPYTLYQFR
jgi:hypothetical protein